MKKLLSLFIACLMIFALVGCSAEESDHSSSSLNKNSSSETVSDNIASDEDNGGYKRGVSTAGGWSSEWIGVKFTPDSSYIMATEEELEKLMEQAGESLKDAGMGSDKIDYAKVTSVYEFMAVGSSGSNIIGMAEKLTLSNITEKQFVEALKTNFESMQYQVTFTDLVEYKIGNTTFYKTESVLTMGTASVKQMYLLKKMDDRMFSFILTETQDGDFEKMLGMLSGI